MSEPAIKIEKLESDVNDLKQILRQVQLSLEGIIRLEERHIETKAAIERAFKAIEKIDKRVQQLEIEQPITKMVRGWSITLLVAIATTVFLAVGKLIIK